MGVSRIPIPRNVLLIRTPRRVAAHFLGGGDLVVGKVDTDDIKECKNTER